MSKDTKMTVKAWDLFEVEKRAALESAKSKMETLKARRGEMLLIIADGDEKTGKRELETIEKEIKEIDIEIESLLSLLIAIPKRRDLARAHEIEETIQEIEVLDARLTGLLPKIDAACEAFAQVVWEYFDVLENLYQINPRSFNFRGFGIVILDAMSFFLHKYKIWERLKIGKFRDYQTMSETKFSAHGVVAKMVNTMRDHTKQLRGEGAMNPDICPNCYERFQYSTPRDNQRRCINCGTLEDKK